MSESPSSQGQQPPAVSSDVVVIVGLALVFLGLFVGRPVSMDDPLFVWTARQIQQDPTDFYGYEVNWYGFAAPASDIIKNPPLVSYFLAVAGLPLGLGAYPLHVAMLVPNVMLVLGVYYLARPVCEDARLAALFALATPALFVSATTLMCDTTMLALWCWAVVCWNEATRRKLGWLYLLSGVLIGLSALSKYFGIALVPLLLVYWFQSSSKPRWWWAVGGLVLPMLMVAAYELYTVQLYGRGLLQDAAFYAESQNQAAPETIGSRLLVTLLCLGGCFLPVLIFASLISRWLELACLSAFALAVFVAMQWQKKILGHTISDDVGTALLYRLHIAIFVTAGIYVLWLGASKLRNWAQPDSLLIVLWMWGTFFFAVRVNWTVSARTLLPIAPALAIIVAQRCGQRPWPQGNYRYVAIGAALVLSTCIAWADSAFAQVNNIAAERIALYYTRERRPLWFEGHWGFQYYMEEAGARPMDLRHGRFARGEIFAIPHYNTNIQMIPANACRPLDGLSLPTLSWLTTADAALGVNFYTMDSSRLLPFYVGGVGPKHFSVFEFTTGVSMGPAAPMESDASTTR